MMTATDGWQPLKGLKVIDFSMLLPGPITTQVLADLGAEVVKVEPPGGDYARHMKSHIFMGANRNKTSIAVDLKSPDAAPIVKRLAKYADIAIEGFRPGVADRLGIGPVHLQALNPDLIYCSLSGFGQSGPARDKAGHDLAYIAMGGGLAQKGQLREPPSRSPLPVADIAGGAFAAIAILAALQSRQAGQGGTVLDLSLFEAVHYASAIRFGFDTPEDEVNHLYPGNDLFTCGDGRRLALTIVEEKFWTNFVAVTADIEPAFGSADFAAEEGRLENFERLMALLDDMFATRPAEDWITLFDAHDVPATICITNQETVLTDHAVARGMHRECDGATVLPFPVVADGRTMPRKQSPPPALGEDGAEILDMLGFSAAEISAFAEAAVVRLPSTP